MGFLSGLLALACSFAPGAAAEISSHPNAATPLNPRDRTVLLVDHAQNNKDLYPHECNTGGFHLWCNGWSDTPHAPVWDVLAPADGAYEVTLVSTGVGQAGILGGANGEVKAEIKNQAWRRNLLGVVQLKKGKNHLTLQLPADAGPRHGFAIRNIDLLPVAAKADYQKRVDALRSRAPWMGETGYGVMLCYGGWTYPESGPKKPWEEVVNAFDTEKFAKMVDEDMGAKWVIWSVTWRDAHFPMPLKSVDAIVPGHTTKRDLPADLIKSLDKRGIKLMFYYHPGHTDPAWWAANIKHPFEDKTRVYKNWMAVTSEIGQRYGDKLAGWFFDDGCFYSPAPFEDMTKAAKTGFPGRMVAYNNIHLPALTDFQDIQMGEHVSALESPVDGHGIYTEGRHPGMQAHGMETVNSAEWGVWQPNVKTPLTIGAAHTIAATKWANKNHQAVSWNFDMYQGGEVTPETLAMFRKLKAAVYAPPPLTEGKPATVSSQWAEQHGAAQAVDGEPGTFWAMAQNENTGWLEVDLGEAKPASRAVIQEVCAAPRVPLVTKFAIEAQQDDGSWKVVAEGDGIGAEMEITFAPAKARKFRLHILESKDPNGGAPIFAEFQLFEK